MARRRRASDDKAIAQGLFLLLIVGYGTLAKFWGSLTTEQKWIFGVLSVSALVVFIAMVIVFIQYRKQKRKQAWQRVSNSLNRNSNNSKTPSFTSAQDFHWRALEKLAAQVYKDMGYRVTLTGGSGDHGVDVRLVNPNGKVELVQCKQWNKPVGEEEVRNLVGSMVHEKAEKAYFWAPRGFTNEAKRWARGKPILLMDNYEIGKLVESVYSN